MVNSFWPRSAGNTPWLSVGSFQYIPGYCGNKIYTLWPFLFQIMCCSFSICF